MKKRLLSTILVLILFLQLVPLASVSAAPPTLEEGLYQIVPILNGRVTLMPESKDGTYFGNYSPKTNDGAAVVLHTRSLMESYCTKFEKVGSKYRIRFMATDKVLTAGKRGDPITQQTENGSESQLFDLVRGNDGNYSILTADGSCFDISGGTLKLGGKIISWQNNNAKNQRFSLVPFNSDYLPEDEVPDGLENYKINLVSYPAKKIYEVGEGFDLSGMEAYFATPFGTRKLTASDLTFTVDSTALYEGRAFTTAGYKTVKVTYPYQGGGTSVSFMVNVVPKGEMQASAVPSNAKIIINDKEIALDAYNIGGSNYFKLRDIAMAVSGGKYNFDITYNEKRNTMELKRKQAYTPVGNEMTTGNLSPLTATRSATLVYVGSTHYAIKGYNIGGSNYFGLRELSKIVDMDLAWDADNGCITLNSNRLYMTGDKTETTENPRLTVVRGIRIGYCTVDALKKLYGEPTEILTDSPVLREDYSAEKGDYEIEFGPLSYYVYADDYQNLMIAYIVQNKVVALYTDTEIKLSGTSAYVTGFYDKIDNVTYASIIEMKDSPLRAESYMDAQNWEAQQKLCFYSTNGIRADKNLSPFAYSAKATTAANKYAKLMAKKNHYNHTGPDGSNPVSRMVAEGIDSNIYSENIVKGKGSTYLGEAYSMSTGLQFTEAWYSSAGHRKNMLSSASKNLGVGIAPDLTRITWVGDYDSFTVYGVQDFH